MHTIQQGIARHWRRLGVLALLASSCFTALSLAPATAWGQLYGQNISRPFFDLPNWARFSDCRPGPLPWGYEVFPNYGPCDGGECPMVESVACPGDFVAHRPNVCYGYADFAPLTIDYQNNIEIARFGPLGATALDSGDLEPEFTVSGKYTAGKHCFGCYRFEATYLGFAEFDDSTFITNNLDGVGNLSTLLSDFSDPPTDGLDNNNQVSIAFQSSFQSAEFNVKYYCDMPPGPFDVSFIIGGRYMRIMEQFDFLSEAFTPGPAAIENGVVTNAENRMYGVQLGLQWSLLKTTRWWMDFELKGAMFNNMAEVTTIYSTTDATGDAQNPILQNHDQSRTSWLGDMSFVAHWQMTPSIVFRAGYQALFVNGVALAADNLADNTDVLSTGPLRLDDRGDLVYHGPILGIMVVR